MIANKICMPCNSIYCESCSKIHLSNQQNHQSALIMTYPLEKVVCIQCIERYVEVYCTKCSEIICSLCKLKYHENHNFKIITTMANKSKFEFDIELFEINWIERSNQTIEKLTSQKIQTYDKIDKTMQNDNHFDLLSILINQDETVDITKHTKYVVNRMNVNRSYTDIMEGEIVISLAYKDEQFLRNFAKLLEGVKNVISIKTDKKKLTNKALQVDEPLKSSSEIQDNMEIVENKNIVDINFDSPKFISLAICCCCNQLTNNLIHCVNCQRFYHNNCHIPPIDKDLKPNHPSLKKWNCTLCQNIETHVIALYKKDFTDYNIINNAEQKPSDPEYKSAEELQIFFYRMLTNWIPNLDIACLQ
ncbi:uncharacterized protein LOC112591369 [Melanaphis sacchari]|uniref:uncharacterized protein LOC112591369 n=1 Tax=Melanaphis sacchari TaxID=742174 RepID=UPI000DC1414C|nr:uncharacterized protein LOC112591369 [Melanaphis sacchari]